MHTDTSKKFAEWLQKWVKDKFGDRRGYLKNASEYLEINRSTLSNIMTQQRGTTEDLRKSIAQKAGVPYQTIISGTLYREDIYAMIGAGEEPAPEDQIEMSHINTVKKFKNQKMAKEINENLLRLEDIDPRLLEKAHYLITGMLAAADVQQTERRLCIDRRSGNDRRSQSPEAAMAGSNGDRRKGDRRRGERRRS